MSWRALAQEGMLSSGGLDALVGISRWNRWRKPSRRSYHVGMKLPTFFLSSTIYDFRDLRSAVKYYLEEMGCKVLASEYNDFVKPLDIHSYEACLKAIEQADYFVLFIGTRVGGWYNQEQRISITQQEYRHAYELQKEGKLKIITFVRAEVWQSREERKELAAHLAALGYNDSEKMKIKDYPSKFAEDAEFISTFINEVGRNSDTREALKNGGKFPPGNWVHEFSGFKEIISALQAQTFSGIPVAEAALRRLLQSEVREILRRCIPKTRDGDLLSPRLATERFLQKCPLTIENKEADFIEIDTTDWDGLTWYAAHLIAVKFHPMILENAIISPFFLRFNQTLNAFEETPFHKAILALREEIRRFNESNIPENTVVVYEHSPRARGYRDGSVDVEPKKLCGLLHLYDRWINIIELCIAIYRHLDGRPFVEPVLRSRTPVRGMEEKLEQEIPTTDEIIAVLNFSGEVARTQ
jgi:hypothetical protein